MPSAAPSLIGMSSQQSSVGLGPGHRPHRRHAYVPSGRLLAADSEL